MTDNIDPDAWAEVFRHLTPELRRWAIIAAKMAEHRKTFEDIARRHQLTRWYIGEMAHGTRPMSGRIRRAFELELQVSLTGPGLPIPLD